jgi:hypothetical protein
MSKKHMFVTLLYKLCSSRVGEKERKLLAVCLQEEATKKKTECCLIHQLYVLMFLIKICQCGL